MNNCAPVGNQTVEFHKIYDNIYINIYIYIYLKRVIIAN